MASSYARPPIDLPEEPCSAFLRRAALVTPTRPALVAGDAVLNFAALADAVARAQAVLRQSGIGSGDRIGISLGTTADFFVWALAALELGAIVVPIYESAPSLEFRAKAGFAAVAAIIVADELLDRRRVDLADAPMTAIAASAWRAAAPDTVPQPAGTAASLAFLHFSSGTTGEPKAIPLTHRNILAGRLLFAQATCLDASSVLVHFLPLAHIYGWMAATAALGAGGCVVVHQRYDFDAVIADIERHRATALFGLPQTVLDFAAGGSALRRKVATLRFLNTGSAPQAPEIMRAAEGEAGVRITTGYGLTEAAPLTHSTVDRPELIDVATVGYPAGHTEIRLIDPDDPGRPAPLAGPGELVVRGPQVADGYLRGDGTIDRDAWLDGGWFRTGDLVERDGIGRLRIVGRLKTIIKYKGYSIAPSELEAVLAQHPAVADCAVIGRPDAVAGEVPTAFVVRRAGAIVAPEELIEFVQARVAPQRRVREAVMVDAIPRSAAGKVLAASLLARAPPQN